jgi:hypothetical protein
VKQEDKLPSRLEIYLVCAWHKYKKGWADFLVSIAIWIIFILSEQKDECHDLWITLDGGQWVGWQHLEVYSLGYYLRTEKKIDTFPKKEVNHND